MPVLSFSPKSGSKADLWNCSAPVEPVSASTLAHTWVSRELKMYLQAKKMSPSKMGHSQTKSQNTNRCPISPSIHVRNRLTLGKDEWALGNTKW